MHIQDLAATGKQFLAIIQLQLSIYYSHHVVYGGPFVSKFKCYIHSDYKHSFKMHTVHSFKTCNFRSSIQQYSFKINLLLIFANQCRVSGLGITLPLCVHCTEGVDYCEPHFLLIKTTTPDAIKPQTFIMDTPTSRCG